MNIGTSADATWRGAVARCPKTMEHGPCGGVRSDGRCEVPDFGRCPFLDALAAWPYPAPPAVAPSLVAPPVAAGSVAALSPAVPASDAPDAASRPALSAPARPAPARAAAAAAFVAAAAVRPVIVADLPAAALSADSLRACGAQLAPVADACLIGDHGDARVQFPPSYRARLLTDAGVPVWAGINCRDRNRVAIEGEIAACVDAGVTGLHCVTGDHPALGHRADAVGVFELDSVDVVGLARDRGALVSVAHAPAAPPVSRRTSRLLAKADAGAEVVFVDHCGGPAAVGDAVAELRAAGFGGLALACVPVVTSAATATVVASFAGGRLPAGYLEEIMAADDPHAAGTRAATKLAGRLLDLPGVDGINLSGGAQPGHEPAAARATAEIARRIVGTRARTS
ncbi:MULTISPECIES: methylenetetrahydrofolate reductase C-terminal domain-containing protein [Frankia]|uniref:methylenetetrahydrofolate reductase C-terminal domain-containing protein n=1 Tax=Frankia TaxID=1854 RepID=UPI000A0286CA|nr:MULTISPECIES: methylenetetrahydrofolate reductase C-terminal domain-containing protein [Frankia]